jgi:hypothetical protein
MKDETERRASEAERLMREPLLIDAFDAIEARIVQELRVTDVSARDKMRDLVVTMQLLGALRKHINTHIETGKLAELAKPSLSDKLRRLAA